jgi:hypothetical protein
LLVSGGSASARLRLVEAIHALGRTAGTPLITLTETTGRRLVLMRLLRGEISAVAPATIFVDGAECLNPENVRLLAAAARAVEDHWMEQPGRRDGIRLILGARVPDRLAPLLAAETSAVHLSADNVFTMGALAAPEE